MLKKFSTYGEALAFGKDFGTKHNCTMYVASVYGETTPESVFVVASPSSRRLIGNEGVSDFSCGGWNFGGAGVMYNSAEGKAILAVPETTDIPAEHERCYHLLACHTVGYSHGDLCELARAMHENKTGVWHECNAMYNRRNPATFVPCPCGRCKKN